MKKFLKITGWCTIALVLVILLAMFAIRLFVDANRFKAFIETQISKTTGKVLHINGQLKWSFFPFLGIEVNDIELKNTGNEFSSNELLRIQYAKLSLAVMPLFIGQIALGDITLKGLQVSLIKNAQGAENWSITSVPTTTTHRTPEESATSSTSFFDFSTLTMPNIAIADVALNYRDEQHGKHYGIEHVAAQIKKPVAGHIFPVKIMLDIYSKNPVIDSHINLETRVTLNNAQQFYSFNDLNFTSVIRGDLWPQKTTTIAIKGNLTADLRSQRYTIKTFKATVNELTMEGNLTIDQQQHLYDATVDLQPFNLSQLMADMGQKIPTMQNPHALQKVGGQLELHATDRALTVNKLSLIVDDSQLDGTAKISDLQTMIGNFAINIDQFNLDHYLPINEHNTQPSPPPTIHQERVTAPATKTLAADIRGTLHIGKLQAFNLEMEQVNIATQVNNQKIAFNPITAKLYQGSLNGSMSYDANNPIIPLYAINMAINNVKLDAMGTSLANTAPEYTQLKNISGTANFSTQLTTQGTQSSTIKQHLNGKLNAQITDGKLKNIDLAYYWHIAEDFLNGQLGATARKGSNETEFGSITATAHIDHGVIHNDDFLLQSPLMKVQGSGIADLVADSINYQLTINLQRSHLDEKTGKRIFSANTEQSLPLIIDGKLSDPDLSINKKELLRIIGENTEKSILNPDSDSLKKLLHSIKIS